MLVKRLNLCHSAVCMRHSALGSASGSAVEVLLWNSVLTTASTGLKRAEVEPLGPAGQVTYPA